MEERRIERERERREVRFLNESQKSFEVFKRALSLFLSFSLKKRIIENITYSREGTKRSFQKKWRRGESREREGKSGRSSLAMARLPLIFESFSRVCGSCAPRHRVETLASGTVNGTTTPTATTLDVRGKEDEQREVSLAARAYDHCRPPVSRRSPRTGGTVVRISLLHSIVFHSSRHLSALRISLVCLRVENRSKIKIGNRWNRDKNPV